jgi:rubredoxin---NAD+ reductase
MSKPLVIIGSGLAGYSVAREWRRLDATTPLYIITAEDGDFYSKPLLSTALAKQKTLDGLVLSSCDKQAKQLNAEIITDTTVTQIDWQQQTIRYGDTELAYDKLVLAVGGEVMTAPLEGDADVLSVNSLMDYRQLRPKLDQCKKVAVLGAGLVGVELANDMHAAGIEVTIIDPQAMPLAALLPQALSEVVQDAFSEAGIHWRLGCVAKVVSSCGSGYQVTLSDQQRLEVDLVISAIGIRPDTLLAKASGIAVAKGIVVDQHCLTSAPNVYALGDCAEVMGQWRPHIMPIAQCAKVLAKILVGDDVALHYPVMPVIVKTPLCPIVAALPMTTEGEWRFDGKGCHQRGLFYDNGEQLKGFVLLGDRIHERAELLPQMPVYLK